MMMVHSLNIFMIAIDLSEVFLEASIFHRAFRKSILFLLSIGQYYELFETWKYLIDRSFHFTDILILKQGFVIYYSICSG